MASSQIHHPCILINYTSANFLGEKICYTTECRPHLKHALLDPEFEFQATNPHEKVIY